MGYSEDLAARVRARLSHFDDLSERSVLSGLGFFIDGRMAVAVLDDRLCLRVDETEDAASLSDVAAFPLVFAGRPVRGWVCISKDNLDAASLDDWVKRGVYGLGLPM